ncbi:UPF0481 protein At3g47200-like [Magnolia sinica]|uniref:UPF0481 protein At3g47200-like n=1 Tax=Magnolia sinica TaxID=86752 RepID=UPI0026599FAC|nr:UPF0481 protein At3g47200-like [Magnolia sinica]
MEKHMITIARRFILYNKSKLEQDTTQVMDNLFKEVMNVVAEARKFYAAEIMSKLRDEAFARMMFLDGCFVLYFIQGMNRGNIDLEISNRLILLIVRDMFLLENHLPFLVLDALMSLRFDSNKKLKGKIVKFIEWEVLLPMGLSFFIPHWWFTGRRDDDPLHLLDALRTMLLGSHPSDPNKKYRYRLHNFGSVMELKEVEAKESVRLLRLLEGVVEKSDSGYLTEIRFKEDFFFPQLLLPQIIINDATISHLLNLTAFEMCSDTHSCYGVTSYMCFLNTLINDGVDVKEILSKHILHHALDKVACLFNEWPIEGMNDLYVYFEVKERIYSHRHYNVKVSIARVLHTYFKSPWTAISFVAAVLLLLFTAIQTGFAAFPRH